MQKYKKTPKWSSYRSKNPLFEGPDLKIKFLSYRIQTFLKNHNSLVINLLNYQY